MTYSEKHQKKLKTWQTEEIEYLKQNYHYLPIQSLIQKLGRSQSSIRAKASLMGITKEIGANERQPWTQKEIAYLQDNYFSDKPDKIAQRLKRTKSAIKSKAKQLGLHSNRKWSQPENDYLLELVGEYPFAKIPKVYNQWAEKNNYRKRSPNQIRAKIKQKRKSIRLDCSSQYISVKDFQLLLGCNRTTIYSYLKAFKKEIPSQGGGKDYFDGLCISRRGLKNWILNHRNIVSRHSQTIDLEWLISVLSD